MIEIIISRLELSIMASEVEETLKRLVAHKGVIGTIVVNTDGVPIKSTLDNATTVQYSGLLNNLVDQVSYFFYKNIQQLIFTTRPRPCLKSWTPPTILHS